MPRVNRWFYRALPLTCIFSGCLLGQFTKYHPEDKLFLPAGNIPDQPQWMTEDLEARNPRLVSDAEYEEWLQGIHQWRHEKLIRIGYDDSQYKRPDLLWTQRDFIAPQMMVEDRFFYDPKTGRYTSDRYLDDVDARYGGIDGVLIWPVYPNIGIDNRNQFDLLRDLPGGIPALRQLVGDFHRRNVRVFFPMMPWDTGTKDEGLPFWDAVAKLMAAVGADGVNGDTFQGIPRAYRVASDETGHPIAFQPEVGMDTDEFLMWDQQSWGYWHYPFEPLVSELKILEPRHMVNVCDRWALNRTDNLQAAFFNGAGYVSWENVWGIWNGITPRDGEALRRISAIYRQFAPLFVSQEWRPGVPTLQFGVFASAFPSENETLWTIVNRNKYDVDGQMLSVKHVDGVKYYDLMAGHELEISASNGQDILKLPLEARGYGAVLMTRKSSSALESFLKRMQQMTAQPLHNYSDEWHVLPQKLVDIPKTPLHQTVPDGMVSIPAAHYDFQVSGIEIEGENNRGVDVQYPWENSPRRQHHHILDIAGFYLDKYPVTNAQFAEFLKRSHYHPKDDHNFLRDWKGGSYPDGVGQQAGDMGLSRRRPCLRRRGRQAPPARVGMAIRGSGLGWTPLSVGQSTQERCDTCAPDGSSPNRPERCERSSLGRKSVRSDGHDRKCFRMDR